MGWFWKSKRVVTNDEAPEVLEQSDVIEAEEAPVADETVSPEAPVQHTLAEYQAMAKLLQEKMAEVRKLADDITAMGGDVKFNVSTAYYCTGTLSYVSAEVSVPV